MYISHLTIWYLFRFYNTSPSLFFCCGREKWRYLFCHSSKVQNELRILWPHQPESELQQVVHRRMDLCWWTMITIFKMKLWIIQIINCSYLLDMQLQKWFVIWCSYIINKESCFINSPWLIICKFTYLKAKWECKRNVFFFWFLNWINRLKIKGIKHFFFGFNSLRHSVIDKIKK